MARLHNFTAVIAFLFIVVMLIIMIVPVDFAGKNIEQIYHSNEGLIWFLGIVIGAAIMLMTYLNGVFQRELNTRNKTIEKQNAELIENQVKYIDSIDRLTDKINKNTSQDNEVIRKMNELGSDISRIFQKVEQHEKEIAKLKKK